MGSDIKSVLSNIAGAIRGPDKEQAAQAEQLRKAQATQMAEATKKAAEESMRTQNKNLQSQELAKIFGNIIQEGLNVVQSSQPEVVQSKDILQEGFSNLQRDLQMIREFIREIDYLIGQGMEMSQALNKMKIEQGGAFWQNLQQVLQKFGLEKQTSFLTTESLDPLKNLGESLIQEGGIGKDTARSAAARAILELLKGESNPQIQKEQFLLALQILLKGDLKESSHRLLSYLRKRGGFSDQELAYYFQESKREIFQGPFPREEIKRGSFWYLLFGLGAFGISAGLGLNLAGSITVGVATSVLLLVFSWIWGKR